MLVFKNGEVSWLNQSDELRSLEDSEPDGTAPCTIETLAEDRKGRYDDGRYRNCSYAVYINFSSVQDGFNPAFISLLHNHKGDLGSFPVQRVEFYDITQTIEIWV